MRCWPTRAWIRRRPALLRIALRCNLVDDSYRNVIVGLRGSSPIRRHDMTKNDFLAKIRLAAAQQGGRIGLRAFCQETGLPEKQHVQFGFANWNDAVRAAGLASSTFFRPRSDERSVVQAVVGLVSRLNKWPSENELTLERRRDKTFPSLQVIRRLSRSESLPEKIAAYCPTLPNLAAVLTIVSGRTGAGAEPTDDLGHGYVYLFRHGIRREFRIGRRGTRYDERARSMSSFRRRSNRFTRSRRTTLLELKAIGTGALKQRDPRVNGSSCRPLMCAPFNVGRRSTDGLCFPSCLRLVALCSGGTPNKAPRRSVTGSKPNLLPLANVLISGRFPPRGFNSERLRRD